MPNAVDLVRKQVLGRVGTRPRLSQLVKLTVLGGTVSPARIVDYVVAYPNSVDPSLYREETASLRRSVSTMRTALPVLRGNSRPRISTCLS